MSAPAPATRRSGHRRFNPLRVLQPKRRLQQAPLEPRPPVVPKATAAGGGDRGPTAPVPIPVSAAPAFDYCRFIELDYVPMESGLMSSMRPTKNLPTPTKTHQSSRSPTKDLRQASAPPTPRHRRTAPPGARESHGNPSLHSSSSGSCKGSDCSPTHKGRQKLKSCTENHGIRPPPPEQYLTPLQQKEVCIRHLRSKLRETIDTLQNRDVEVDELRERLFRMQEDWVEEECHRVEAQLALKEARTEIQALKAAVEGVRARLGDTGDFQDVNFQNHRLEALLLNMEAAQGSVKEAEERAGFRTRVSGSAPASVSGESPGAAVPRVVPGARAGSCSSSPARSMGRSSTYTKLTEAERGGHEFGSMSADGTRDSGFVCESGVPSRADLLLEAAYLSEETASLLSAYTQTFAALPTTLPTLLPTAPPDTPPNTQTTVPQPSAPPHVWPHAYSQTLPHSFPRHQPGHAPQLLLPHSCTYEGLLQGERLCCRGAVTCMSHPCLSHHLYLQPLREAGIQTESCPLPAAGGGASDLDTIAERTFRSQACSPTSTWASDEGEELDSTSLTTATVMSAATEPAPSLTRPEHALPRSATMGEGPLCRQETQGEAPPDTQVEGPPERQWEGPPERQGEELLETPVEGSPFTQGEVPPERQGEGPLERQGEGLLETPGEGPPDTQREGPPERQGEGPPETRGRDEESECEGTLSSRNCKSPNPAKRKAVRASAAITPSVCVDDVTTCTEVELEAESEAEVPPLSLDDPQTSQPKRCPSPEQAVGGAEDGSVASEGGAEDGAVAGAEDPAPVQKSYWSRHFLVDLLAVAIPVVPTVAWLCRGPTRDAQPMYHFGSLLRGCCTVALTSLRRSGGLRHYPAGGGAHI